jgi:hypothetical protein
VKPGQTIIRKLVAEGIKKQLNVARVQKYKKLLN